MFLEVCNMIRHIVMWKFKESAEGNTKEENIRIVSESLFSLVGVIDEIKKMEIGVDLMHTAVSMDLALVTEFETLDTLHTYAVHPEHVKVADFVRKVTETRVVLDSEI